MQLTLKNTRMTASGLAENEHNCTQGDSGGICATLGNDSMSDSKQKSS